MTRFARRPPRPSGPASAAALAAGGGGGGPAPGPLLFAAPMARRAPWLQCLALQAELSGSPKPYSEALKVSCGVGLKPVLRERTLSMVLQTALASPRSYGSRVTALAALAAEL